MRKYLYILILVFAVACFLRFYPFSVTGLPFSTDGWSSIRNTELLIKNTPVSLTNDGLFDGYNNYWPANSLFGAVFSEITGLAPIDAMAISIPLAGALTVPLFYVLVHRITENTKIALIATILLATAYPYALFTGGVTKETFANPLYVSVILIFLLQNSWKRTLLFSLASAALVLSHHLTAILTIGILFFLTFALFYSKDKRFSNSIKSNVGLLAILVGAVVGYFGFFAYNGLNYSLTSSDLLTATAYSIAVFSVVLFFCAKNRFPSRKIMVFEFAAILVSACSFMFLLTRKSLVAGAPTLPFHFFLYVAPYLIVLPLMTFSFRGLSERRSSLLIPVFWLALLLGFEGYAIFGGSPLSLTLTYRTLNFLLLPLCILIAVAFYKLHVFCRGLRGSRALCVCVVATVLVVASLNSYSMYAAVSLQEPYMGYFWLYREPEMATSSWVAANSPNLTVAGDMKVSYLLNGYFNVNVNALDGLKFLQDAGSTPRLLFVYPEMYTNGYVLYSGTSLALSENWTQKLADLNSVYSNGMVNLYSG